VRRKLRCLEQIPALLDQGVYGESKILVQSVGTFSVGAHKVIDLLCSEIESESERLSAEWADWLS